MTTKRHDSTAWVACVVRCDTGVEGDAREGSGLGRMGCGVKGESACPPPPRHSNPLLRAW